MDLARLIRVARGEAPADLLLANARIVDLYNQDVTPGGVAILDDRIAAVTPADGGSYAALNVLELDGACLAPGFIDGHVHIESSMVTVPEFARAVVPHGTTAVITDPHEVANVLGMTGVRYMLDSAKYNPLSVYVMMPSCVPATNMETAGAVLHWYDIAPYQNDPWVLGLAEMMNFPGVVQGVEDVLDKLRAFEKRVRDGHAPGLSAFALQRLEDLLYRVAHRPLASGALPGNWQGT